MLVRPSHGGGHGNLKVDGADLQAKGKGAAVLNHKPTKVLQLSMCNPLASRKPDMRNLHQKLAAG